MKHEIIKKNNKARIIKVGNYKKSYDKTIIPKKLS